MHPRYCVKILIDCVLCRVYCFNRANVCTSATVGTYIRIDFVDVALGNCFYGTFIDAGAACSAIIVDFVSHFYDF
jgi:hypothetical protein